MPTMQLYLILLFCISTLRNNHLVKGAFNQAQEIDYLNNFNSIIQASYSAVDDSQRGGAPSNLLSQCKRENINYIVPTAEVVVSTSSSGANTISSIDVEGQCDLNSICIVPSGISLHVTSSLNVGALIIRGSLEWTDDTQISSSTYICAGYIAVEGNGIWNMTISQHDRNAWIYLKDNGAVHSSLRSRAFGGVIGNFNDYPIINIRGRKLARTWSLLSQPLQSGDTTMTLLHNPDLMGWKVGDRIAVAPTKDRSEGSGAEFYIQSISSDGTTIGLSDISPDDFDAEFIPSTKEGIKPALKSAEVVNLSRSIVITGDDFNHIPCENNLPEVIPGEQTSSLGCRCASFRSQCTMGLHTSQMFGGESRIEYTRIEKCGQRGVEGKYCLHLHKIQDCPRCLFLGNAIENAHQRGIIVHGTHSSTVEDNVLYNVRGAGIYIEDGNEMLNDILYNAFICNFPFNDNQLHGCTVPGTSNRIADTSDNQSGIYSRASNNNLVGNRASGSFNGMLLQALGMGRGSDNWGKVCEADNRIGLIIGNVFHSHGRFGTYSLGSNYPKVTDQSLLNNGRNTDLELCSGFDSAGNTRGLSMMIEENLDYGNAFVGHYNAGDIQYNRHHSYNNLNNMYWKETKGFEDGCAAHITHGHYAYGNLALPDQSTFIIEHTTFEDDVSLEANHHCNVGVTGVLCMPQYILHDIKWENTVRWKRWVIFQSGNFQGHTANQSFGGIFSLSPPNADKMIQSGNLEGSIFPPGFVSVVSSQFRYLLSIPGGKCVESSSLQLEVIFDNGILCKVPLRSLQIYSRNLVSFSAPNMLVQAWFGIDSTSTPHSSQEIGFHQVGNDYQTTKQGYSLPVVPGSENTYRLSLVGSDPDIPNDWVVEFSDWVMGNRWSVEYINLELSGRTCANGGLVNSHHDRRFLWSGDEFMPNEAWGNHGACVSSTKIPEDMPTVDCGQSENSGVLTSAGCPELCSEVCNNGSYCDCGSKTCKCKPGFGGDNCLVDLCAAARCGPHGTCAATYLGTSSLLPVTNFDNACICEDGWSGNLCQFNPCATLNKTCSGNGKCVAFGDVDAVCECNDGYSGENCEVSCDGFCQGTYPFGCNPNLNDVVLYGCNQYGGCSYKKEGEGELGSGFCAFKQVVEENNCLCESGNECLVTGTCDASGQCSQPTKLPDGTPCNSIPWGVCQNGMCLESSSKSPTSPPVTSPPSTNPTSPPVTSPPSTNPTSHITSPPSTNPTSSPISICENHSDPKPGFCYCPIQEFFDMRIYLPLYGYCIKFELFPGGEIALDSTDQTCSNTEHTASLVVSKFDKVVNNRAMFVKAGAGGYSGTLDFTDDNSSTESTLVPRKLENQEFILGVNVPSCNQGPIYPVYYEKIPQSLYLPVGGRCYRVEIFDGAGIAVDGTDPTCSNSFTAQAKISTFNGGYGNELFYDKFGANGFGGKFKLFRDTTLTGTDIKIDLNSIAAGSFDISLTFPPSFFAE